jgi:chitodextrinase
MKKFKRVKNHKTDLVSLLFISLISLIPVFLFLTYKDPAVNLGEIGYVNNKASVSDFNNNLVLHYNFDEGSGTLVSDISGGGNNGLFNSMMQWSTDSKSGGSALFNDPTAVVTGPDVIGNGASTINVWIKPSTIPFLGVIASNNSSGFNFRIADSFKRLQCTNSGSTVAYSAQQSIKENIWQMVTAVRSADGKCTLYVNGELSGSPNQDAGPIVAGNKELHIGRRPASAYPFSGLMDDYRIYNRELSSQEILDLFTEAGGVPTPVSYTLSVAKTGSGSVTSSPSGINCGNTCSMKANEGTPITLDTTPSTGSTFSGWGGSCSGTGSCTITLSSDLNIEAKFVSDNPPDVNGNIVTAKSCSQIDVQAAIDAASSGGTVLVPAGNCSWAPIGGKAVTMNKSITLRGAGMGQTNITLVNSTGNSDRALSVSLSSDPFRITGFTFNGDGLYAYIVVSGSSKNFRIDHISNVADTPHPPRLISVVGQAYGVIDHIDSHSNGGASGMILIRGEDASAKLTGNVDWLRSLTLGSDKAVYIEDSTFVGTNDTFTSFNMDIENGGRVVFRKNVMTNVEFGSHGAQSSGGRGARSWEIYENVFNLNLRVYSVLAWLRGGTGVIFNNKYSRTNGGYGYYIAFDNPRSHTAYGTFGSKCDGTNIWDGNEETNGYPCLDQVGRGEGDPRHQSLSPAYEWNNTLLTGGDVDIVVINSPSNIHIKENRDYFNDVCKSGYSPYPYPHPVVQEQDNVGEQRINLNCPNTTEVPIPSPSPIIDTIKPTISLSPLPTTVKGGVTVSASASDNVGVAGVQFKLNGSNLGSEIILPPYSFTWNTQTSLNGTYTLSAVARDLAGNIQTSNPLTVTVLNILPDLIAPSTPANLVVSLLPPTGASLAWTPSGDNVGVLGYKVYRDGLEIVSTPNTIYTNTNLTPDTTYTYTVAAYDAAENISNQSISKTLVTPPLPDTTPPNISNINTTSVTANSATFSWITDELATTQVAYGLTNALGLYTTLETNLTFNHAASLVGLTPNTTYYYSLRSTDLGGNTKVTPVASIETLEALPEDTTPPVIVNLGTSNISSTQARTSLTTNEPTIVKIYYGPDSLTLTNVAPDTDLNLTHNVKLGGLTRDTTYYYKVEVEDAAGNITTSNLESFRTLSRLEKPPKVTNIKASPGSVILSWNTPTYEYTDHFVILRSLEGYRESVNDQGKVGEVPKHINTWTDTNVSLGITYFYSVFTIDDLGVASDPTYIAYRPGGPTRPIIIPNVSVNPVALPKTVPQVTILPETGNNIQTTVARKPSIFTFLKPKDPNRGNLPVPGDLEAPTYITPDYMELFKDVLEDAFTRIWKRIARGSAKILDILTNF